MNVVDRTTIPFGKTGDLDDRRSITRELKRAEIALDDDVAQLVQKAESIIRTPEPRQKDLNIRSVASWLNSLSLLEFREVCRGIVSRPEWSTTAPRPMELAEKMAEWAGDTLYPPENKDAPEKEQPQCPTSESALISVAS